MSRYIDADALKRKAQKVATEAWKMRIKSSVETILNQFIDWIDAQPTADVVLVKHGKWVYHDDDGMRYDDYHCSVCRKLFTVDAERIDDICFVIDDLKYCPNCGAKMDNEDDG